MRGLRQICCPAVALICGIVSAFAMPAHAVPLDPQACEQLQSTLDGLRRGGVEADMALGPAQAKSTLPPDRFNRIAVFIETEEQLNFRCGLGKERIILPTTVEGGEEEIPAPVAVEGAAGAIPLPQRAPREAKEAAAKLTVVPKTPAGATEAPAPPARRPPAAAKAKDTAAPLARPAAPDGGPRKNTKKKAAKKADDAYRAPPKPAARSEQKEPTAKQ